MGKKSKEEAYFVFPPEEDDINIPRVGLLTIDFTSGKVRGSGQGVSFPQLQNSLSGVGREFVRSLHLETDKKIRIYTDSSGSKELIPIKANDIMETQMVPFKKLFIKILTADTKISCISGTSLVGFTPKLVRSPSTVGSGNKDVAAAGTAEQLSSTPIPCQAVDVVAKRTNTGIVYVGGSNVSSSNGRWLYPGEAVSLDIKDASAIYLDVATSKEGVTYLCTV